MPPRPRPWIVTPHDPIEKLEENLWTVEGAVPGPPVRRRMAIVRQPNGDLVFVNAIPLEERALAEVLAWGRPAALVVPHHLHGMDAPAFAARLGIGIYGPARDERKMRERFPLAGTLEDLGTEPALRLEPLDGTRMGEPAGIVRSGTRVSLVLVDAYQDYSNLRLPLSMRLLGFGGGPKTPPAFRLFFVKERAALRAHLLRLSAIPGLARLVPCHGPIRTEDPAGTLRRVAEAL